jgi:hypothetical protein
MVGKMALNHQEMELLKKIAEALENISKELAVINNEGVVIFMGSDHLEN